MHCQHVRFCRVTCLPRQNRGGCLLPVSGSQSGAEEPSIPPSERHILYRYRPVCIHARSMFHVTGLAGPGKGRHKIVCLEDFPPCRRALSPRPALGARTRALALRHWLQGSTTERCPSRASLMVAFLLSLILQSFAILLSFLQLFHALPLPSCLGRRRAPPS